MIFHPEYFMLFYLTGAIFALAGSILIYVLWKDGQLSEHKKRK